MAPIAKSWRLLPHDGASIDRLARALNVSPVVAQLLLNRQVSDPADARRFLDAPLAGLHPPHLLPGASEAAERIVAAQRAGRKICIYGDYDVDGTTASAILIQTLRMIGGPSPDHYVPHRLEEGYGLNIEALRQIRQAGVSLVVTVDCGINSRAEADAARILGLELIVTDHHQGRQPLPAADVLVHPDLPGRPYPFPFLAGAGVAFKLAWAICQKASGSEKVTPPLREHLLNCLALAALGTVADVVPLRDENRIFVRHGLARLRKTPYIGLKALLESTKLREKTELLTDDIGFKLAPRLNAVGRLGWARLVVELLTTSSPERAESLAKHLEEQNLKRQTIERRILAHARERLTEDQRSRAPALVLDHPEWHAGIIGIVAGRLVDQFARPVLMIALRGDNGNGIIGQGSGRSIPGFPLHEALQACDDLLLSHGGHAAAAGFKIRPDQIGAFRDRFCSYAAGRFGDALPQPRLTLDAELPLQALTVRLVKDVGRLEPYGSQNVRPLFLAGGLQVAGEPRKVGAGERHLSFRVKQGSTTLRAIAFNMAERMEELMSAGGACSLAFTPRINEWQGLLSVDLDVTDLQPGPQARLD